MTRSKIFISYCREDEKSLDQLRPFLRPLEDRGLIDVWDDTRLLGGEDTAAEIGRALDETAVAVLLVSSDFLASKTITEREPLRQMKLLKNFNAGPTRIPAGSR